MDKLKYIIVLFVCFAFAGMAKASGTGTDESGNVDVMVAGTAPTMDDGKVKLTITYEDEAGAVSSVEKEIQLYVTEPVPMEDMMDVGNMDDIGMMEPEEPPYQKYLIPGAAGAVLLIVVIVIIRRKKKKAGMASITCGEESCGPGSRS